MGVDDIMAVPRGGEGLGIGCEYPVGVYGTCFEIDPEAAAAGWREVTVSWDELRQAGFNRPAGEGPVIVDADGVEHEAFFFGLADPVGQLVATWDEGRWWTPLESEAFAATMQNPAVRMLAETTYAIATGNRAQRRRRRT